MADGSFATLDDVLREVDRVLAASGELLDYATEPPGLPVTVRARANNRKLSPQVQARHRNGLLSVRAIAPYCAATYTSIETTCPASCPFKGAGCFVEAGAKHLVMARLDAAARGMTPLQVTQAEADAIDRLYQRGVPQTGARGGIDMRLHIGGEVSCRVGARLLAAASDRYRARGGGLVWTYTHRWREIPRTAWGQVSALASVQGPADVPLARALGYVPAITVRRFPGRRAFRVAGSDVRWIPCPAEVGKTTCVQCRLCLHDDRLRRTGAGIAFQVHGAQADQARTHLPILRSVA